MAKSKAIYCCSRTYKESQTKVLRNLGYLIYHLAKTIMNMHALTLLSTILLQDTIFVKLSDVAEICNPIVLQEETNDKDVKIVLIICATIAIVALIAKWAIWSWQKTNAESKNLELIFKNMIDKEDREIKQASDLINKELELLQELCYDIKEEKPKRIVKEHDSQEIKNYIKAIDDRLKKIDKADNCQTTK